MQQPLNPSIAAAERSKTDDNGEAADKFRRAKKRFAPFPGRDAARSPCEALLRRTGIIPKAAFATAPALQRTAPQELRATLRPGNEQISFHAVSALATLVRLATNRTSPHALRHPLLP